MLIRQTILWVTILGLAIGCSERPAEDTPAPSEPDMPGFLDEPPPPPTPATEILGGGTLVLADGSFIEDSLIVITNGKLVAWGKRGEVEVPNDSIGIDVRGKWIQAARLEAGANADLQFSERTLGMDELNPEINGTYADGVLTLSDAD